MGYFSVYWLTHRAHIQDKVSKVPNLDGASLNALQVEFLCTDLCTEIAIHWETNKLVLVDIYLFVLTSDYMLSHDSV